ncbi:polyamine-modulated factor 1 [Orussus abietinus]|uniref:polyamine-modulated factor 1 n=1 Tax=Orussus abietinus TaxID=222816 RepID=UPI000625715D|nr:polyamine-modulated factor 1 [Orussus abietinus]
MAPTGEACQRNNVLLFRAALSNGMKSTAESVSESAFLDTFTILKRRPGVTRKLYKILVQSLQECMEADLKEIFSEENLINALAKVNGLSEEAIVPPDRSAWRPPGNVEEHLRSLDAARIKEECVSLEKRLNDMEAENEVLMNDVTERRSKLQALDEKMTLTLSKNAIALPRMLKSIADLEECMNIIES